MELSRPFEISPRLLPGIRIGSAWISLTTEGVTPDGRTRYRYYIDLSPKYTHTGNDLKSGVGGGSIQEGFESLLSFLGACAESIDYSDRTGRTGENADLFPERVGRWASEVSDHISMLALEIEEAESPLISE